MSNAQKDRERGFREKNAALGRAFAQYLMDHPHFAEQLPFGSHVIFEVEDDDAYNTWSEKIGDSGADPDQPVVHVSVGGFDLRSGRIIGQPKIKEAVKPR